jgi:hypothetical protein
VHGETAGYWMLGADGAVYAFGAGHHAGNATGAVDLEPTPSAAGYWIVDRDGHVIACGDAHRAGILAVHRRRPVLAFGDATFVGDMRSTRQNGPVLGSVPRPSGLSYDRSLPTAASSRSATPSSSVPWAPAQLNAPVQSLVPDGDGRGYWVVATDGGIFAFDAPFRASMGAVRLNRPVTGMVRFGNGYLMVGDYGGILSFSDQPFLGSLGATTPTVPVVAIAALGTVGIPV